MSTKTLGVVGRGSGLQKVGIELGSFIFYSNSSQPGMFQTFAVCGAELLITKYIEQKYIAQRKGRGYTWPAAKISQITE